MNLLDPDPEARRKNLATVTEGLALAEAVGARCCVDIAGSFSTDELVRPAPRQPLASGSSTPRSRTRGRSSTR